MMEQTKFFIKEIPKYMRKHGGWLKIKKAFARITKQPVGMPYKTRYGKYNAWQMQKAVQKLEQEGKIEKWSDGIYRLKRGD